MTGVVQSIHRENLDTLIHVYACIQHFLEDDIEQIIAYLMRRPEDRRPVCKFHSKLNFASYCHKLDCM